MARRAKGGSKPKPAVPGATYTDQPEPTSNPERPIATSSSTIAASSSTTTTKPLYTSSRPPLFFFKEDEIPNGYLCQWYRCSFTDAASGLTYNCTEQYMMHQKAVLFGDTITAAEIMRVTSPRKQKQLGREVENFDEGVWIAACSKIVEAGNYLKFTQGTNAASMRMGDVGEPKPLKQLLLSTGERELVEASPFDRIWGIGFKASEAMGQPRARWGMNLLGKALMEVRAKIVVEQQ